MPRWNARPATQAEVDAIDADLAALDAATLKRANNLSDVTSGASARNNIGSNQLPLETRFSDLAGATGEVRYLTWPFASGNGFATRFALTLEGPLATGDATIGVTINGVATTPATVTIPLAGSTAGRVTTATFTANNAIAAGAQIGLTVSGANTANVGAGVALTSIF